MTKIEEYRALMQKFINQNTGEYFERFTTPNMSDMDNWLCVHVTSYMPRRNKDSQLYIPTTGMATGYKYPRATIHFTINQIVAANIGGNWDAKPIIVLAPYNGIVANNGEPRMVASEDTFFIPNPDTGLLLPTDAHIVKPNDNTLLSIGDKVSTYKSSKFTNDEIDLILSFMRPWERKEYEKYANAKFEDYEMRSILSDERVQQLYESATNKRKFLNGLFAEDRRVLLAGFLRDLVTRMAMEKMGYQYVWSHENDMSAKIANAARAKGIEGDSGNKGHSCTLESDFEHTGCFYLDIIETCQTNDIEKIYNKCLWGGPRAKMILSDEPLDMYKLYQERLNSFINHIKSLVLSEKEYAKQYPEQYGTECLDHWKESLDYVDKLEQGGISAHNPYLDIVLHRNASRLNQNYAAAKAKLKQNPKYPLLKKMLVDLMHGKKWYKTPDGWKPEYVMKPMFPPMVKDKIYG